ncbi:reverse transcriptase domain-containing protein [Chrysiogenes arsenatis]|uniref:reverse transcriptase domain-containing protein n=1 Tax=Chrysiogenes arsenatis TaxID=309797 RepID=UPI000429A6D4|nr:reverse transcriptase domain-containing protein [Chrysiogenes arsenatis]
MPKRFGNLYDKIFTVDNLFEAYRTARKNKRKKLNVHLFECDLGGNIMRLHEELHSGNYTPRPYKKFTVREPKPREISAPDFRDVVVQHAIYKVILPIFDKTFIHNSYGCRRNKGTHKASDRAQQYLRESPPDSYTLQLDIRKYYYSINRETLRNLLEKKIKDKRLIDLIMLFANGEGKTGVPIGNLLSQLLALIYLNKLDHFIQRELKVSKYVRYVDDFILFGLSSDQAKMYLKKIQEFLLLQLQLTLSKWGIAKVSRGVNFVGFRTWRNMRFVRKHSMKSMTKAIKRGKIESIISILGNAHKTSSFKWFCMRIKAMRPELISKIPNYKELSA